jgi:hypothetical protein
MNCFVFASACIGEKSTCQYMLTRMSSTILRTVAGLLYSTASTNPFIADSSTFRSVEPIAALWSLSIHRTLNNLLFFGAAASFPCTELSSMQTKNLRPKYKSKRSEHVHISTYVCTHALRERTSPISILYGGDENLQAVVDYNAITYICWETPSGKLGKVNQPIRRCWRIARKRCGNVFLVGYPGWRWESTTSQLLVAG